MKVGWEEGVRWRGKSKYGAQRVHSLRRSLFSNEFQLSGSIYSSPNVCDWFSKFWNYKKPVISKF